ncbi:hypothetical protein CVT24_008411 [Panaeolus cyanescens]|uniref:P-loop containing nucleoside triphosphate hydrolase protein n=1 Tax=Panaeolus cyanescens TaxID=181874 RepID=A0A409VBC5_9AGAR|nr:hypothetical protein CVT24_008411 [Panaeolus cyanescens]
MQFDPTARQLLSQSTSAPAKRSHSQQAAQLAPNLSQSNSTALPPPPPTKLSRPASPSGQAIPFSSARHRPHQMSGPNTKSRRGGHHQEFKPDAGPSSKQSGPSQSSRGRGQKRGGRKPSAIPRDLLDGPFYNEVYIETEHKKSPAPLKDLYKEAPKVPLNNFYMILKGKPPTYDAVQGSIFDGTQYIRIWRTTVQLDIQPPITAIGDHPDKKQSMYLAALSAVYQLQELGVLESPKKLAPPKLEPPKEVSLTDGSVVTYEKARSFMDFYCRRFHFGKPDIEYISLHASGGWEAIMMVDGRRIGIGSAVNKRDAQVACYLDVTKYLDSCDDSLWKAYQEAVKMGKDLPPGPKVLLDVGRRVQDAVMDLSDDIRKMNLWRKRPSKAGYAVTSHDDSASESVQRKRGIPTGPRAQRNPQQAMAWKSEQLAKRRKAYLSDPSLERMRASRAALPVYTQAKDVLAHIAKHDVTICMAATGSGKTTQIPQMILDEYIDRGEGGKCNIICTQPRRLAAISVADRVAKERGEALGQSIGYQVRFESNLPDPHGSITFCTTGVFLKRLQSMLVESDDGESHSRGLDHVTHIIVDEVHERDVDTDLLLVVLKHIMARKKAKNQPLKIVLMSATIDPTLFQSYFAEESGKPADVITVPGRSYPVTKFFMDNFVPKLLESPSARWILNQENVVKYLHKELPPTLIQQLRVPPLKQETREEDLDLPYPLIAATIVHVLQSSQDGHVLVFLPGWEEISATQKAMLTPLGPLPINFNDSSKYTIHLLHSTIPLAEQQAIFEPPPPGVRRIILATNIAETSVTIPDVVYVIDSARVKEQRYDPHRHMSQLVSAWVGSSNLNQRAGRAGRHRSGEYFGILSERHANELHPHQTVEMKRVDLSNVVMHIKALNFPGMTVEEVLAAAIEPPDVSRVEAAMSSLKMVGALDTDKNLTALGRVLLQLPVDVQMGKMVLFGSFFRCLDDALTLAAILTNRDPFMSPIMRKEEAAERKHSWSPLESRSDALATLRAFNSWWEMQSRGQYVMANRFCIDNFLSKPTLLMIQKIKVSLLQALYRAGVIDVSAGGEIDAGPLESRSLRVPAALDVNRGSLPLLTALICIASQPRFAVRDGDKKYRTKSEKAAFIHPSSVNYTKKIHPDSVVPADEKQLYAFSDKRRNESIGAGAQTFLITTTRVDPLTYVLFGAYNVEVVERGLECDEWLQIVGHFRTLDEVQRLKSSIDACMLRVYEGITMSRQRKGQNLPVLPREEEHESESGDEEDWDKKDYSLSREEVRELDDLTKDLVNILDQNSDERIAAQSRQNSRPATPLGGSPNLRYGRLDGPSYTRSRPATPLDTPAWRSSELPGSALWRQPGPPNEVALAARLERRYVSTSSAYPNHANRVDKPDSSSNIINRSTTHDGWWDSPDPSAVVSSRPNTSAIAQDGRAGTPDTRDVMPAYRAFPNSRLNRPAFFSRPGTPSGRNLGGRW